MGWMVGFVCLRKVIMAGSYILCVVFCLKLSASVFYLLGKLCRERKVFFHTDAAQAIGKIPLNVQDMKIDLMSISGHKIYGPKGG